MKKISILIAVILCSVISFGQGVPIVNNISISNPATQYHVEGLLTGDVAVKIPTLDTLLHPATTFAGSIIRFTDGFAYMSNGVFWERIGFTSGDTLLAELPLYIDINLAGQRVLKILHPDGIVTPGYVSWSGSGLTFDVTSSLYYLNYQQYISPSSQTTLAPSNFSNPRIDKIGVDTNSSVINVTGTASATPISPQLNPSSQLALTDIYLLPGDTIPSGIRQVVIYDENIEWATDTVGTITVDYDNTDNPYHLAKAAFVQTYTDQSKLTFTDTGLDTAQINEILKLFIYSNGTFSNNIYFQLWNDTTAVTNQIALNSQYGFNPLDSNAWQNVTIPFSAFTFSSQVFNKLIITMGGADTTGAKGLYFDYIQLQLGITTPPGTNNKVDSVFMVGNLEYYGINGIFTFITDLSHIPDTVFTRIPIAVDTTTIPGKQILYLLHLNGLESGTVTIDSCMTIDVTATVFYLNYKQYTGAQTTGITITAADPSNPRIDRVVIDTNLVITVIEGTPSATPIAPPYNSFSQVELAQILVGAGVTCIGDVEVIYDGIIDDPAQWDTATSGTLSVDFSNTANPYHLAQAAYTVTYTDSSQLIFTKPSGTDTVKATSVLKGFIYIIGGFTNQISGQWFNGTTAVSSQLLFNPYFNPNDSNQYQIFAIPLNAWSFPSSSVFNKLVLTFGGDDVSSSKGIYLDWIQLQTGISNIATQLQLTTIGTSGAATLINNVLNIPIYSGGGGGGGNNIYNIDSSLASDRTVDLNGKILEFSEGGTGLLELNYPGGESYLYSFNPTGGGNTAGMDALTDATSAFYRVGAIFDGLTKMATIAALANATTSTITHTADTHIINGSIQYNAPVSGASTDSVLTWDAATNTVNMIDAASFGRTLQETLDNGSVLNKFNNIDLAGNELDISDAGGTILAIDGSANSQFYFFSDNGNSFQASTLTDDVYMLHRLGGILSTNINGIEIYNAADLTKPIFIGVGSTLSPYDTVYINKPVLYYNYVQKTATYAIERQDYTINCTSGTFTVTLPDVTTGYSGRVYVITNSGAGVITLATSASQTFQNVVATPTTLTLSQFNTVMVQGTVAGWLRLTNL